MFSMLEDILKAIEEKATQEIEKIEQEKEKEFLLLAKSQEEELARLKEQNKAALKEETAKEITEVQQKVALANSFPSYLRETIPGVKLVPVTATSVPTGPVLRVRAILGITVMTTP